MEELHRQWGKNIRKHRRAFDLTQEALADEVGVSRTAVVMWEAGNRAPHDRHKIAVADALHADVREMFPLTTPSGELKVRILG